MITVTKQPSKRDITITENESCNEYSYSNIEVQINGIGYVLHIEAKMHFEFELFGGFDPMNPANHNHSEELEITYYEVYTMCGDTVNIKLPDNELTEVFNSVNG